MGARAGRRGLRLKVTILTMVAIVVAASVGYVSLGLAFAGQRVNAADSTLNMVTAHQNSLNKTLGSVDATFSSLTGGATFNPTQARAAADQFIAASKNADAMIDRDDADLSQASAGLRDAPWLTMISRSNLDHERTRIDHAHQALTSARAVAAGHVQDGQFMATFIKSTQDLSSVINSTAAGDWANARSQLSTMKTDVNAALQASSAPGLPAELHSAMLDLQVFAADYGKLIDASQAGDDAGVSSATNAVQADAAKIGGYNFDQIVSEVDAYYKPLIDRFNSQMALATR